MFVQVIEGQGKGKKFPIPQEGKLIIGRGEASDTRINDTSLSRSHCHVQFTPDGIVITDLGSTGGTFIDGKRINSAVVASLGSTFKAGNCLFKLMSPETSEEETIAGIVPPAAKKPAKATELVGEKFGPFKLVEIIGKGVSGIVYKANDLEKKRPAAVKVLLPELTTDDDQRQRFVRAMQTILPIKDPHILELYNAGKSGAFCWAAMEYVDGPNLAELIDKVGIDGMLDWQEVWRAAIHISRALRVAYTQKIIHRNVTPTNILRRDKDKKFLLGDFMLAKALEGKNARQITQPGQLIGDLAYMAPERTHSDATVDTRSDIYGLGATCYALLTGKPPAGGSTLPEIISNIRNSEPPMPKTVHLSVDELFQEIIMKMIAKDPADRFQDPKEVIIELQRIGKFNNLEADWSDWVG